MAGQRGTRYEPPNGQQCVFAKATALPVSCGTAAATLSGVETDRTAELRKRRPPRLAASFMLNLPHASAFALNG